MCLPRICLRCGDVTFRQTTVDGLLETRMFLPFPAPDALAFRRLLRTRGLLPFSPRRLSRTTTGAYRLVMADTLLTAVRHFADAHADQGGVAATPIAGLTTLR